MSRRRQPLTFTALIVALAINQAAGWAKVKPLPAVVPTVADTVAYEEITLSDAVHRALAQNVVALVARDEVRRSEALLVQARSAALPAILLEGTLARSSADRAPPGAETVRAGSATIRVPLIAPRAWASWSEAAADVATAAAGDEDARRTVAVSVARAFIAVTSLKRRVQAATRAVGNDRAHYDLTHARFAAGAGSRVDEVRAAQQLATDEATLSNVYVALSRAREALSILVGADEPLDTSDQIGLRGGETDVAAAQRQRSDVRAARQRVAAAARVKTGSWTDFAPALVGEAQLLYQDPPITKPCRRRRFTRAAGRRFSASAFRYSRAACALASSASVMRCSRKRARSTRHCCGRLALKYARQCRSCGAPTRRCAPRARPPSWLGRGWISRRPLTRPAQPATSKSSMR